MEDSLEAVTTPSLFFIQLAALLLPGVIWARVDQNYGVNRERTQFEFAIRSILFGLAAHAITYGTFLVADAPYEVIDLAAAARENVLSKALIIQIAVATAVGFMSSILWLYAINYKWITRLLQAIRATSRYGDEDVWEYTFNSNDHTVRFVHVRDIANGIVYAGWVSVFSESEKLRELVLSEVDIYDASGNLISSPPQLYISFKPDAVHIEFPLQPKSLEKANVEELTPSVRRKPWLFHGEGDRRAGPH